MPQLEEKEKHDCTNEPIGKVMLWLAAFAVHGCEHVEMPKSMLLHASLGEKTEYNRLRCVVSATTSCAIAASRCGVVSRCKGFTARVRCSSNAAQAAPQTASELVALLVSICR